MGQISKETYKKLVLLYLIGKFPDGIYTSYRFQKVLYFSTKDIGEHPFTFEHTQYGEYSYNARRVQDSLVWLNLIEQTGLQEQEDAGAKWLIADNVASHNFANLLPSISPDTAHAIDHGVDEFGFKKSRDLVAAAEADDLLKSTPLGSILFSENLNDLIEVPLDDDDCEDIELALSSDFISSMDKIVEAVETTDFDMGEVKVVGSIL